MDRPRTCRPAGRPRRLSQRSGSWVVVAATWAWFFVATPAGAQPAAPPPTIPLLGSQPPAPPAREQPVDGASATTVHDDATAPGAPGDLVNPPRLRLRHQPTRTPVTSERSFWDTLEALAREQTPATQFHVPTRDEVETETYGAWSRQMVVYMSNSPIPFTVKDVDRIVGSPWSLKRNTAAKLKTLSPRIRLTFFAMTAETLHGFDTQPNPDAPQGLDGHAAGMGFLQPRQQKGEALLGRMMGEVTGHFRPEELVDLVVFAASQQAFFPDTERDWRTWQNAYVKHIVLLGAAFLLTQLAQDRGMIGTAGYVPKVSTRHLRLGWYGNLSRLGFGLKPTARGGFRMAARGLDVSGGLSGEVNTPQQQVAVEVDIREHLLAELRHSVGWDMSLSAHGRFVAYHVQETEQGRFRGNVDWMASRPAFLRRNWTLIVRTTVASDVVSQGTVSASGVIEDRVVGGAAAVHASVEQAWFKRPAYKTGFLVGGVLDPGGAPLAQAMVAAGRELRREVNEGLRWEANLALPAPDGGPGHPGLGRVASATSEERQERLRRKLTAYLNARDMWLSSTSGCAAPTPDWCGALDLGELDQARTRARTLSDQTEILLDAVDDVER